MGQPPPPPPCHKMLSKTKDPEGVSKDDLFSVLLVNVTQAVAEVIYQHVPVSRQ